MSDGLSLSLADALQQRRSGRVFSGSAPLDREILVEILRAMQRVTGAEGRRTAPSAGGLHTLKLRVAVQGCSGISDGGHEYDSVSGTVSACPGGETTPRQIQSCCVGPSEWVAAAPAVILVAGRFAPLREAFGDQAPTGRCDRYLWLEAGCVLQNGGLAAAALGASACIVGGFDDDRIAALFGLAAPDMPLALLALGMPG
ncbi:nitroreductase family protein [Nisaea sp.]|uniref:nitroreductase family protein n=1 Tax=Nisaea sp. TaxID=2024842 RepID=UPI0032EE2F28